MKLQDYIVQSSFDSSVNYTDHSTRPTSTDLTIDNPTVLDRAHLDTRSQIHQVNSSSRDLTDRHQITNISRIESAVTNALLSWPALTAADGGRLRGSRALAPVAPEIRVGDGFSMVNRVERSELSGSGFEGFDISTL